MKRPSYYLKKIGHRGQISIWLVDGTLIRKNLDQEFTNFGQYYHFKRIPKNEFWIDHEASPDERRFFIDHLLVEWRLMKNGATYPIALDTANITERSERSRSHDLTKVENRQGIADPAKVHLKKLKTTKKGLSIWLVDGRLVRSVFDINFTEGGHDLVYPYVPKKEIWIDNDISPDERPFVLLHELFERSLMAKKYSYNPAHRHSSRLEWSCRRHPEKLQIKLSSLGA
ncbi:hypothetical protein A3K55_02560 [Candidatus Shapirobacteria bacterium RBG_13_44_7]|uniref:Uncharacterized protein n=1 Tax=Candidatus Shapirobacteria bacterium RBG_13_44_7 TaxID=1802149 RepID=A0A1F7SLI3_9BACT|nr:MAG: hypothetical protein A3K55_02560 [Candidatus Shapirobacteria bacterium RBG_13_44_7]